MDRAQEKVISSQAKLQALDQSANIHQKLHDFQTGINRNAQRKISIDGSSYGEARIANEGLNGRNQEQLISPLPAQYFNTLNPGVGLGIPAYLPNQAMDHRNLFYRHHPMPMFSSGYSPGAYSQRLPSVDSMRETTVSSQTSEKSESSNDSREPIRTESVIKIATERTDVRKQEPIDKRHSRPANEDFSRNGQERNGDHVTYRESREKSEVTSNGDARHLSNMERNHNDLRTYQSSSANNKSLMSGPYGKEFKEYQRLPPSQSNMFSSMPKLTPIAPRGHASSPFSTVPTLTEALTLPLSTNGPSVRPTSTIYHKSRDSKINDGMVGQRGDSRPEDERPGYMGRSVYEQPGYWERSDVGTRYPGHSAYQGYSYSRMMHSKRPDDKENTKEHDIIRNNQRQSDTVKESSISPDRSLHSKDNKKSLSDTMTHSREIVSTKTFIPAVTSPNNQPIKNQVTLSKSEKPVLPDNARYKVCDEKKNVSKSDKVKVIPKQGMAYVVSVRETPRTYYANGENDRTRVQGGYEPSVVRKDDQRAKEKSVNNSDINSDLSRRRLESNSNDRNNISTHEDAKNINDRNNNSSLNSSSVNSYSRYNSERSRPSNKISLGQDKVFVPPNVTLEMFEKREMERSASRAAELSGNRTKISAKKETDGETRYQSPEQITRPSKQEIPGSKSNASSKTSDDEELKIIDERAASVPRSSRQEETKRPVSPARISRITSPSVPTTASNPPYLTPFGMNFPSRRTPTESEIARENAERSLQAAYLYGGGLGPYSANAAQFAAAGGRGDVPVMLPMDMLYGGLYKHHLMDPAVQGGAVMQDPLTGSLVVVPEALLSQSMFNPLAESQLMLDPRFWGMQASMEDPRWQQFYQQQTKQMYEQIEKYKHELLAHQQGRLSGYQFYPFYQKHLESQKKAEEELAARLDQRSKSQEETLSKQRPERPDEKSPKEKPTLTITDRRSSYSAEPRREDIETKSETNQRLKTEKHEPIKISSNQEKSDSTRELDKPAQTIEKRRESDGKTQEEQHRQQFQQYLLREPVFDKNTRFPFPRIQPTVQKPVYSPPSVTPRETRDVPPKPALETTHSPQVVSAAATLANMDIGTRFPFTQQSIKQSSDRYLRMGTERNDTLGRKMDNSGFNGKGVFDKRPVPLESLNQKVEPQVFTKMSGEESPSTLVSKVSPVDRQPGFDINSLIRDLKPQSHRIVDNNTSETTRLLVAKAEKLPQDEELEVIRIDTPYKVSYYKDEREITEEKAQEMNLLLSMSQENNYSAESPSSKSEIFWIECSDSDEDFEVQAINDSTRPIKVEFNGNNKENSIILSLQSSKSEDEKKIIREKIERLREVAKGRTREERFTTLTRQKELKSPSSIVNSVTASLNEVLDTNGMEKDIRMRLADLQKKYREKHRELARLQPRGKHGNEDNSGSKNTPVKRGPGRPRKRKYFGASLKSEKATPQMSPTYSDTTEMSVKNDAISPVDETSPTLKTAVCQDYCTSKPTTDLPEKKKKKKTSVSKKEDVRTSPSPINFTSALSEKKVRPKQSRKNSSSSSKSKSPSTIQQPQPIIQSIEISNMDKLIDAISPMFADNTKQEKVIKSSSPTIDDSVKPQPTKNPKKKKDKLYKPKDTSSSDVIKNADNTNPNSIKNGKDKPPKKPKKKGKTPSTPKIKTEFEFPHTNGEGQKITPKKKESTKLTPKVVNQEKERELSENDDVFTSGSGALDLLANFASSASFEKDKIPLNETSFKDGALFKGMKRGRPRKSDSPTAEQDSTNLPKKKRKKKKLPVLVPKSPKKIPQSPDEKENQKTPDSLTALEQHLSLPPSPPVEPNEVEEEPQKNKILDDDFVKVLKEGFTESLMEEDMPDVVEPEGESTPPPEPIKDKRRKSKTSIAKELQETKQLIALYGDWQPRRSERIFINSSVPPNSSSDLSPLSSPTSKTADFTWSKKTKKIIKGKKVCKSEEPSDEEPTEEESNPNKLKKKKSPVKAKKRRTSSSTDPDFIIRAPKRKAAKRDRSYEEFEEDDEDEEYADDGDELPDDDHDEKDEENDENVDDNITKPSGCEDKDVDDVSNPTNNEKILEPSSLKSADNQMDSSSDTEEETKTEDLVPVKRESENKSVGFSESDSTDKKISKESTINEKMDEVHKELTPTATIAETTATNETSVSERSHLPPEPVISFTKEELKCNTKMLLPVDRVFFRGRITFFQEPDLFGIVLPGERGRRPHLRSTEQLLSQAVKDIIPPAVEYLPVGTRVCAHWSPQYRCFYPGNVIETPPDEKSEIGKLWVEFDDGDSGIFPLSDLRKIITECPVQVDDVESDVVLPDRLPRLALSRGSSPSNRRTKEQEIPQKPKDEDTSGWESTEDAPVRRTRGRGRRRVKTRDRRLSEDATDSDAPRLSQESDEEDSAGVKVAERLLGDKEKDGEQTKRSKRQSKTNNEQSKYSNDKNNDDDKAIMKNDKRKKVLKHLDDDTDDDEPIQGTLRCRPRSSRLSDRDLRKKSLTLNLNNSSKMVGSESPAQESTSQEEDSGSCSEVFDESPQTENKTFQARLGKRRRSMLSKSKQSPGERWSWSGKNHQNKRKGKGRKVFYKSIVRGDETISVGDCAVFTSNPSKSNNLPYVGKIESMWEGFSGNMVVRVKWFYHPEETKAGRKASDAKHSLYRSTHIDENDVQTISHKCEVVSPEEYKKRTMDTIGTRSTTADRPDRLFSCVGTYDPSSEKIDQE